LATLQLYSVMLLSFKIPNVLGPAYLIDLLLKLHPQELSVLLEEMFLIIPKVRPKIYGEASFSYYGPSLWNSLTEGLRSELSCQT